MQTATNTRTKQLIAVGTVIALAILSVQAYALATGGSLLTTNLHQASGVTNPQNSSTISVAGNGQANIQSELAMVTVGVNTQGATAQAAAQENANTMAAVVAALENLGINSSDTQTASYNIYQNTYSNPPPCNLSSNGSVCTGTYAPVTGYTVDNEILVKVSVTSQALSKLGVNVGAAIDAAVAAGANEAYGVQFTATSSQLTQANQQALQLAVKNAASQANALASALGVTVTGVVSVSSSSGYSPYPVSYDIASAGVSTPVAPQTPTITASVQAVYAVS